MVVAVSWLVLPFTAGDAFAAALDDRSGTAQWVIGITAWAAWALGVAVIAVARTSSLTVARYVVPAGLVATVAAGGRRAKRRSAPYDEPLMLRSP